jgi:hypothetical protein
MAMQRAAGPRTPRSERPRYGEGRLGKNLRKLDRQARVAGSWLRSRLTAPRHADDFARVERFCMFLGYPRSGHSLVGSLIDAHPDAVVAHELNVLRYLKYGFGRDQIFWLLLENARAYARYGRSATGYSYEVPGQHQGSFRTLRVIGDKRGSGSVRRLRARPALLERLRRCVGVPVKFLHVARNPYDNIATMYRRSRQRDLEASIDFYFVHAEGVSELRPRIAPGDLLDLRHEELIRDPEETLARICRFLELEPARDYLEACASILFDAPRRTRGDAPWTPELLDVVHERAARHPFLAGYSMDD